jgi:hypothetical protein
VGARKKVKTNNWRVGLKRTPLALGISKRTSQSLMPAPISKQFGYFLYDLASTTVANAHFYE